jgi:hypothetical protein
MNSYSQYLMEEENQELTEKVENLKESLIAMEDERDLARDEAMRWKEKYDSLERYWAGRILSDESPTMIRKDMEMHGPKRF